MRLVIKIFLYAMAAGASTACAASARDDVEVPNSASRQTLTVHEGCDFHSCGVVPAGLKETASVECASEDGNCLWSPVSSEGSVSYRQCNDGECPARPAVDCPNGTTLGSQVCGSENDAPCAWTATCIPPRVTTPCASATGCDDLPLFDIGVICKDGTNGGFACVTDGQRCFWERDCD
ncbi:MAG: hypothetical protein QM784_31520 [Polyangiaceae bacterium]